MHTIGSGHIGKQINQHGDFKHYAMDGLEAKHSTTKDIMRRLTNSKLWKRLKTAMTHYTLRETVYANAQQSEELRAVVELKTAQRDRRQESRLICTAKRVATRQADLSTAYDL